VVYLLDVWPPRRLLRPFLAIGLIGGYTTFSTYAAGVLTLDPRARPRARRRVRADERRGRAGGRLLSLSEDLPMAIIIVDTAEKTTAFLDDIAGLISGGLVIVEDVDVHTQADGRPR